MQCKIDITIVFNWEKNSHQLLTNHKEGTLYKKEKERNYQVI